MNATSPIRAVVAAGAPAPRGPYSHGIVDGGHLFTSGFGPHDAAGGPVPEGITLQTRKTLDNIAAVLREVGADFSDVVKTTAYLADVERDFAAFNAEYATRFGEPFPARTTVGAHLLGILVEIDVVVALPATAALLGGGTAGHAG